MLTNDTPSHKYTYSRVNQQQAHNDSECEIIFVQYVLHKAAEHLNYTQSNITQQIKNLEESLQQKLFIYKDKTLAETSFLNDIIPMINDILRAHDEIYSVSEASAKKGTLRVAAPE